MAYASLIAMRHRFLVFFVIFSFLFLCFRSVQQIKLATHQLLCAENIVHRIVSCRKIETSEPIAKKICDSLLYPRNKQNKQVQHKQRMTILSKSFYKSKVTQQILTV